MTLKRKVAINISIAFSVLYGLLAVSIYISFSRFRTEEFKNRLEDKAQTTIKLLFEIRQIDRQLLRLIDQNTINKLYNEKTLVFDSNYKLIYSSIDDATIKWNINDLKQLNKSRQHIFRSIEEKDMVGVFYDFQGTNDYHVLVAAEDKYGHQQLDFLRKVLALSFLLGTALVWFSTYAFVRKQLKPLDDFQKNITDVTALRLNDLLPVGKESDEIALLTTAFNEMMARIDASFNAQKEFTANASHELRTPVSRLTLQLESVLREGGHSTETETYLRNMRIDLEQVGDLIQSLLLLARMNEKGEKHLNLERIDEVIFDAFEKVKKSHQEFHMNFGINQDDVNLEVYGTKSLLGIVFVNLLRNAYLYSDDKNVNVYISQPDATLEITIENSGRSIPETEQLKIFEPFMRGENSGVTQGSGLGLRIVKRILDYHGASISYLSEAEKHQFTVSFPLSI